MSTIHPTKRINALIPSQLEDFACTGAECPDNCCTGWTISIDRKTFNAYKKSTHPNLKAKFAEDIHRKRKAGSDAMYGYMAMDTGSRACSFMQDKLCSVQSNLGEDLLSNTCSSYPRLTYQFDGLAQQGMEISCPAVAQKVLLSPTPLEFVESPRWVRAESVQLVKMERGVPQGLKNDIRFFSLRLVRDTQLPLWQRLAALGMMCSVLDPLLKNGEYREVQQQLNAFMHLLDNNLIAANFEDVPARPAAQLQIFKSIWQLRQTQFQTPHQAKVFQKITAGIAAGQPSVGTDENVLLDQYTRGLMASQKALQGHPHFLENFLVSQMFTELFPYRTPTLYEGYLNLITRFGVIRFMLAFQCAQPGPLPTPHELVDTVQVFSRKFEHDQLFASQVSEALMSAGMNQLERVIYFLRDDLSEPAPQALLAA
jgi:lysine-N-methylase